MLKSLKEYDYRTVELVLSAYTSALLPNAGVEPQPELPVDSDIYDAAKQEIHKLLKIAPSHLSQAERGKVFQFLAREMSEVALASADIDRIKERIGQRGELRTDLYEIKFNLRVELQYLGVRESHVRDTIMHPDSVEDVLTDTPLGRVLHLKTHNKMNNRDRFSLLTFSKRVGNTIHVQSAWRIYHADIGVSEPLRPLDLLKAFAENYGLSFTCGSYQGKFLLYDRVEGSSGTRMDQIIKLPALAADERVVVNFAATESAVARLYSLAYVYLINQSKYVTDLRRRGVQITLLDRFNPTPLLP